MHTITLKHVDEIFNEIVSAIPSEHHKIIDHLDNIKPKTSHQIESIEWRYILSGYIDCLYASEIIEKTTFNNAIEGLFCRQAANNAGKRPGRDHKYSVDIITEKNKIFSFDVMSMNPLDAYVKLTKRIAYKAIPGIEAVLIYAGLKLERNESSSPLQTFTKDELVYVTLL